MTLSPESSEILDAIIKLGAAAAVVWGFIRFIWPILQSIKRAIHRVEQTADAVLGSPGQPGIRELTQQYAQEIGSLKREIMPNGGGSVSDRMAMLLTWMQSILDNDDDRGHLSMTKTGDVKWVNRLFLRWLGASPEDLEDKGWIGFLHPDDKETAAYEWDRIVRDERVGTVVARFSNGANAYQRIVLDLRPQFGTSGHLIGFIGRARILLPGQTLGAALPTTNSGSGTP